MPRRCALSQLRENLGDVVYSNTHMYLAETTTTSRREWIASLARLKDLHPLYVVAGHKRPGDHDDPVNIDESIRYLTDFNDAEAQATTATELYARLVGGPANRSFTTRCRPRQSMAYGGAARTMRRGDHEYRANEQVCSKIMTRILSPAKTLEGGGHFAG